jgi:hypothetical protein
MTGSKDTAPHSYWGARARKIAAGLIGMALVGTGAYAATNWIVGLNSGSSGEGQSPAITNVTISAVASPTATNLLYPGGNGDVVATITNPNSAPVTVTAVDLPANTAFASGYSDSALSSPQTGCSSTTSDVVWNYATSTSGSTHTLTTPLVVGPNATLTVTFTNDASMTTSAPAACEATYFSMPSLTGIAAYAGAATPTTSPAVDSWTS